jgi:hypothetical protein
MVFLYLLTSRAPMTGAVEETLQPFVSAGSAGAWFSVPAGTRPTADEKLIGSRRNEGDTVRTPTLLS